MNVVIFGASGRIGSLLVQEMLDRGHHVRAFVYGPNPFDEQKGLRVIQGDVHDADAVEDAIRDMDAVLSSLGSWGTPTKDILSSAMRNIVPAMERCGIKRIVSLTGADARVPGDRPDRLGRLTYRFFSLSAGKILHDGEEHIQILSNSGLDWTVVRSPVMKDNGSSGRFRLGVDLPKPWATISRKDVVKAMCDLVENRDYAKQAPVLHRS